MRLAGKTAVVTGAQQGIGRAIAVALARDGANVAINFLDDEEAAARVADDVRAQARQAILVRGDVSRPADVEAMLATVVRQLGPPDVVVNNAGVFPRVAFLDMTEGDWDHVLDVNLKGLRATPVAGARGEGRRGPASTELACWAHHRPPRPESRSRTTRAFHPAGRRGE